MEIVELGLPERAVANGLGVNALLPKMSFSVGAVATSQRLAEHARHVLVAEITQLLAGEFTKRCQGLFQSGRIEISIEHYEMHVRRHDHVSVDAQTFLPMAEVEALADDVARLFTDEDGKPLNH